MDKLLWNQNLTEKRCPPWPCPICQKGIAHMVADSLEMQQTTLSKQYMDAEGFDPQFMEYNFTSRATCGNEHCKQSFAIAGSGGTEVLYDEDGACGSKDYFSPVYINPMPDIISIPKNCPKEVAVELRSAFRLLRSDSYSCANRIRVSVECLMTHLKVAKRKKGKKGKYDLQSLDARIRRYAESNKDAGDQLMALKWIGNAGSHSDGKAITQEALLDAFEVMEYVLSQILDNPADRMRKRAREMTARYGGRKAVRRSTSQPQATAPRSVHPQALAQSAGSSAHRTRPISAASPPLTSNTTTP